MQCTHAYTHTHTAFAARRNNKHIWNWMIIWTLAKYIFSHMPVVPYHERWRCTAYSVQHKWRIQYQLGKQKAVNVELNPSNGYDLSELVWKITSDYECKFNKFVPDWICTDKFLTIFVPQWVLCKKKIQSLGIHQPHLVVNSVNVPMMMMMMATMRQRVEPDTLCAYPTGLICVPNERTLCSVNIFFTSPYCPVWASHQTRLN